MIAWWWVMLVGAVAYAWGRRSGRRHPLILVEPGDEMVSSIAACLEDPAEEWAVEGRLATARWACAHNYITHASKPIVLIEDVKGEVQVFKPKCYLTKAQQQRLGRSIAVAKTFIVQRTTGELPPVGDLQQKGLDR